MGLNIGLYLRRSEGPIRRSEVLVRKSEVLVRKSEVLVLTSDQEETKSICLCKQETHVEDSPRALVSIDDCMGNCGAIAELFVRPLQGHL